MRPIDSPLGVDVFDGVIMSDCSVAAVTVASIDPVMPPCFAGDGWIPHSPSAR